MGGYKRQPVPTVSIDSTMIVTLMIWSLLPLLTASPIVAINQNESAINKVNLDIASNTSILVKTSTTLSDSTRWTITAEDPSTISANIICFVTKLPIPATSCYSTTSSLLPVSNSTPNSYLDSGLDSADLPRPPHIYCLGCVPIIASLVPSSGTNSSNLDPPNAAIAFTDSTSTLALSAPSPTAVPPLPITTVPIENSCHLSTLCSDGACRPVNVCGNVLH
ncbi:hypothetical protein SeLEV6574_g07391 [Synchytrium endobioticum]|uniref:Uncharacterized protein n=1 Tax=Synchytrium endobioticum TaxID=286115 RepID=A0A507CL96_9FUNG|nr:hypothetical protein SeLEV6574_g07391 [Synchytrium endobioticum]